MPNFPYSSTLIMSLNGQAYFDCSTNLSNLFTGQNPFTVEAWVKFNDLNGSQTIVGTYGTGDISQGIVGLMLRDGSIINVGSGQLSTLDVVQNNTWYFVALTFDGTTLSLYLDGVLQSSTTSFNTTGTNNFMIGAAQSSSGVTNKLNGSLQSVVIWPESRDDQIMKDMNLPLTPLSGVSAWFSFMQFTPADISGNQVPAQLSGSLTPTVDTPCLQVPGSSGAGYGDCGAPDSLNFTGTQPFTLEAWVYPEKSSGGAIISKIATNCQPMYQLAINGSGNLIFAAYQSTKGTSTTMLSTTQVPVNEWSHVAGTYDGNNTLTLYFNGQPVTASPFILGGSPTSPAQHTLVGSGLTGHLAYARIWNVSRSGQEINDSMNDNVLNVPGILANYDFATMSAYLPPEIDIYEQTIATTRPDLTTQNTLSMIGTANVVFFDQPVSDSVAQSMSPVAATSENVATTPLEITPEMAEALTAAIGGATPGSEAQRKESVSNTKLQELVEEFSAILPANLSPADLQARKAQFEQNLQRLFAQAQTNPDALPEAYAKWASRGNKRVLTYFSPKGKVDLAQADTGLLSEQTEWWVEFAVTLIMGIIDVFFDLNLATAAVKLTKFLFKEVALIGTIAILFSAGVHAVAIVGTLDYCYNKGYLKQMVLIVIEEIGWWALAKFCAKILGWLVPGLGEAQMVASLAVLIVRLGILIATYPG